MDVMALIASRLAAPKQFRVTTQYADGRLHHHDTETAEQADTWTRVNFGKLGRDLINRETGNTVRRVAMYTTRIG